MQATLSIIKPDAVSKNVIGKIIDRFEKEGLKIIASKMIRLDKNKASGFYLEHEGKPFYEKLVNYSKLIVDTRNAMNNIKTKCIVIKA